MYADWTIALSKFTDAAVRCPCLCAGAHCMPAILGLVMLFYASARMISLWQSSINIKAALSV